MSTSTRSSTRTTFQLNFAGFTLSQHIPISSHEPSLPKTNMKNYGSAKENRKLYSYSLSNLKLPNVLSVSALQKFPCHIVKMFLRKEQELNLGGYKPKKQISHFKRNVSKGFLILSFVDVAVESL